ncbi:MAG: membrane protein insertion efficiency factor YidD [Verrucomicrobiota bacterium]
MRSLLIALVRIYQWIISPLLVRFFGHACRYQPTCSNYAIQAIEMHGWRKGVWLALKRICRCHPWGGYGFDPVPKPDDESKTV